MSNTTGDAAASSSSSSSLPPGRSAPLLVLTSTDQAGVVAIAAALSLSISLCATLIRLSIRREFRNHFDWDDWASFSSIALSIVQSALVFLSIAKGFGKTATDVSPANTISWQKDAYASEILYPVILGLTRASIAWLYIRLTPDRKHLISSYAALGLSVIFAIISVFVIGVRCDISKPWIFVEQACPSLLNRWVSVTSFNVTIEVLLFACAVFILQGLQLPWSKKIVVLVAFGQRLLVIIPSFFRLHWLGFEFASSDPGLDGVLAAVFMQIELAYAIVATTTPCLRPFMSALNTNYGGHVETKSQVMPSIVAKSGSGSGYGHGDHSHQISLNSMSSSGLEKNNNNKSNSSVILSKFNLTPVGSVSRDPSSQSVPRTRWDKTAYNVKVATVGSGDDVKRSLDSSESRQMIINKDTAWTIDYEERQSSRGGMSGMAM